MKLSGYSENELTKSDLSAVYGLAFSPVHDAITSQSTAVFILS